ncbi:MAG: ABC transporter substrate-binding protein [Methylobacterium sp.]|nr:ABC transporter substrate-binding protein [Methylobacterium sp.]
MKNRRIRNQGPHRRAVLAGLGASAAALPASPRLWAEDAPHRHGIAMHGEPDLPAGFPHLPYANPNAPKGGLLRQAIAGSFDTLNSMSVRGNAPAVMVPYIVQPLMMRSQDEPFTLYGLLAESVATPPDRSFVEFRINARARFADGKPVTAADVAFSWKLFTERGRPNYRRNAEKIARIEIRDERTIRFTFKAANDLEFPLIIGLMPVLPAHATEPERFENMGFNAFLGSGPYRLEAVEPGTSITLQRRADYWGADWPAHRGLYNFDTLRFEFFRDSNTQFEAFKTGLIDFRAEIDPAKWLNGYDIPALRDGRIERHTVPINAPKGMSGFIFNTRRVPFSDIRVREAMLSLFDFEWLNANLFSGVYRRTGSFFDESDLSFRGNPLSEREIALVGPELAALPPAIRDGSWAPPKTDGSGRDRVVMRRAIDLLREAGYAIRDGVMTHSGGQPLSFEILVTTREKERIALAFADTLRQVGIRPNIRLVDSSQYWARLKDKLFDCIIEGFVVGASPGQEQVNRWSSIAADQPGTLNWAGVRSPVVDRALSAMLAARSREDFTASVRALDRLLVAGHYVLPLYHLSERWLARWSHIRWPERLPRYDLTVELFWFEANR